MKPADRLGGFFHCGDLCREYSRRGALIVPSLERVSSSNGSRILLILGGIIWWTWSGSNRRPLPCHGSALPNCATGPHRRETTLLFSLLRVDSSNSAGHPPLSTIGVPQLLALPYLFLPP